MHRPTIACGVIALAVVPVLGQSVTGSSRIDARCGPSFTPDVALGADISVASHGDCPAPRFGGLASSNDSALHFRILAASVLTDIASHVDFFGTRDDAGTASGSADMTMTAHDILFTDIAQPGRHDIVNVSMNYVVAARVATQGFSNCSSSHPQAVAHFGISISATQASGDLTISGGGAPTQSGALTGYPNDGTEVLLSTPTPGGVDLSFPTTFFLQTSTRTGILYCDVPPADIGDAAAMLLVHLPCGTPVFNVPPGITVNSAQLGIVDNIWGGLLITQQPADALACGGSADFTVIAQGSGPFLHRWQWMPASGAGFITVTDGPNADPTSGAVAFTAAGATTDQLHITSGAIPAYTAQVRCEIGNACSTQASSAATLRICAADLNCDGLVDFGDYLEFLNKFEAQDLRIDFNGDGLVDFADYLEFLNFFDAGC